MEPGTVFEKQEFRRSIEGYRSPFDDPFLYKTIDEVGRDEVVRMLLPFIDGVSNLDPFAQGWIEFQDLIDLAGTAFQPQDWLVAYLGQDPVGVVFPSRWENYDPSKGSIKMIAIVPEMQGRGFAKILHAKGIEVLASIGVTTYIGSTEMENTRMIQTFLTNGCERTRVLKYVMNERGMNVPYDVWKADGH